MPTLEIRLLHKIEVQLEIPLKFPYGKVLALLIFLLLESGKQRRERLTELLWPQQDEDAARSNLRNAAHALKKLLGSERIGSDREFLWFTPLAGDDIDVLLLETVELSEPAQRMADRIYDSITVYAGELAWDFRLPDAPTYTEWLELKRLEWHSKLLGLSDRLLHYFQQSGQREQQIALAQLQTRIDPWNETLHLRLLQLLLADGRTASAQSHFDYLRNLFRRELDIAPGDQLQALIIGQQVNLNLSMPTVSAESEAGLTPNSCIRPVTLIYIEIRCLAPQEPVRLNNLLTARQTIRNDLQRQGAMVFVTPDGSLLGYFGHRSALPQPCQTALRAARQIRQSNDSPNITLRIALHHGPMLTLPDSPDPLGDMSDIVIKLAGFGRSGDILVSADFARRIDDRQSLQGWRSLDLLWHGVIDVYRIGVEAIDGVPRPQQLIGRETEQRQLLGLWRKLARRQLQAAMIVGPPGCGKTRLAQWLNDTVKDAGQKLRVDCRQAYSDTPFQPLAEMIKTVCNIQTGDDNAGRRRKLDDGLLGNLREMSVHQQQMLAWLVGLPLADDSMSPTMRRRCLHQALLAVLAANSAEGPLLLIVEDLHCADPSTLAFFAELPEQAAHWPILLLFTARHPFADDQLPQIRKIRPSPLNDEQAKALIKTLLPKLPDPQELNEIISQAAGNPLYLERFSQTRVAAWISPNGQWSNFQDSVLAAMGGDENLQAVAQAAAVVGESFNIKLLKRLLPQLNNERFRAVLGALERLGLIHLLNDSGGCFHHALIRDVLYKHISFSERRRLHGSIRQIAPEILPELTESRPHWLAHHAEQAGDLDAAADLFEQAAYQDLILAAHREAASQFRAARLLLERLPSSRAHERRILKLMLGEGNATVALYGYGAAETRAIFSQLLERGHSEKDRHALFLALYGLWLGGSSHGGYRQALAYVDKLQRLAEHALEPVYRLQTAYAYGNTHLWLGELSEARRHLERAVEIYQNEAPADLLQHFHEDTGVTSLSFLAWAAWLQGDDDVADHAQSRALALAERLQHPYSLGFALACAARLQVLKGCVEQVQGYAEALRVLGERQSFAIWQGAALCMLGWSDCAAGKPEGLTSLDSGLAVIDRALPALEVTFLAMRADALYRLACYKECAELLEHILLRCDYWEDYYLQAELLRLQAACAVHCGNFTLAETARRSARDTALQQGALTFLKRITAD